MKHPDNAHTEAGANRLAETIRRYWAAKGKTVNITIEPFKHPRQYERASMYAIRSDMVNGLPA